MAAIVKTVGAYGKLMILLLSRNMQKNRYNDSLILSCFHRSIQAVTLHPECKLNLSTEPKLKTALKSFLSFFFECMLQDICDNVFQAKCFPTWRTRLSRRASGANKKLILYDCGMEMISESRLKVFSFRFWFAVWKCWMDLNTENMFVRRSCLKILEIQKIFHKFEHLCMVATVFIMKIV